MSDQQWLNSQPKSWHDLNRALHDISVLLQYIGEMPDARLLFYFSDTRDQIADGMPRRTTPPCNSYTEFLNRLFKINSAFETGMAPAPAGDEAAPLDHISFAYWSRDFLAAVAAPATADSIRLTRDYMIRRAQPCGCFRWLTRAGRVRASGAPPVPALLPTPDETTCNKLARKLARWVQFFEWLTVGVLLLTVMISIYALSGRLILENTKDTEEAWSRLDAQVEVLEDKIFPVAALPIAAAPDLAVSGLCELTRIEGAEEATPVRLAGLPSPRNSGAAPGTRKLYLSAKQAHLCDQRAKLLRNLFVVTMHLQTWSSVVTQRIGAYIPLVPLAPLFGVVPATMTECTPIRKASFARIWLPRCSAPAAA